MTTQSTSSSELHTQRHCLHPQVTGQECLTCGFNVGPEYGLRFEFIQQALRLSHEAAARLRELCTKDLLRQKKLILVLDIDHTLLHTVDFDEPDPEDMEYLKSLDDLFLLEEKDMIVKLRPFLPTFLKEASLLFEMYLYTRGTRKYARDITRLIDPDHIYFGNRIISRDDTPNAFKTLDLVAGEERGIVIVDDTKIWPEDKRNLLLIEKYFYFDTEDNTGHLTTRTDESQTDGGLMRMLTVLRYLHTKFFNPGGCRDMRLLIALRRYITLKGCRIHVVS
ncbi:hypothetical protein ACFE04_006479 [Oxalis oulophora]